MRKIKPSDFEGRTVEKVEVFVGILRIKFTDGRIARIEQTIVGNGQNDFALAWEE